MLCTTSINPTLLACTMAFSSGVMLYVSLVEVSLGRGRGRGGGRGRGKGRGSDVASVEIVGLGQP